MGLQQLAKRTWIVCAILIFIMVFVTATMGHQEDDMIALWLVGIGINAASAIFFTWKAQRQKK